MVTNERKTGHYLSVYKMGASKWLNRQRSILQLSDRLVSDGNNPIVLTLERENIGVMSTVKSPSVNSSA